MIIVTHALTGAAIGAITQNPVSAFVLGVISHHILDSLPHFDQGSFYIDKDRGPSWAGAKYVKVGVGSFMGANYRDWIILGADILLTLAFATYIALHLPFIQWLPLICGALGGLLPDILDVSPFIREGFRKTRFGNFFHEKIHEVFHWPLTVRYLYIGIGIQVLIVAIDLWFIKKIF